MPNDREIIDALCRLNGGWSSDISGDHADYMAAHEIVAARRDHVRGMFAPSPSLDDKLSFAVETLKEAVLFLGEYSIPKHPRAVLSIKCQDAIAKATL